jgi:hypothetical protein
MGSWDTSGTKTVGVSLWAQQARGLGLNARTIASPASRIATSRTLREMYVSAYRVFAHDCRAIEEPGLAIVAVHEATGQPQGIVRLMARVDRHVAAVVGRHDRADLFLNASEHLALRQLAIVMDPLTSWQRGDASVRYRVLDLRTTNGFADEQERALRGMRCEGPALLRVSGHALFVLPLGDPTDWPASAADAWDCLPERVYFDELSRSAEGSITKMPVVVKAARRSMLVRTAGPHDTVQSFVTGTHLVSHGVAAGVLEIEGPQVTGSIEIGHDELRDGVLLGRYERCANAALADDPSLSRVHALMLLIDDRLLMVDTASINGTRLIGQHRSRVLELAGDTELQLGKATRLRWRYVS